MFSITEKISFIENVFGKGNLAKDSLNLEVYCPICSHRDRTKKKLVIKINNDINHCWLCGWKARNLLPLLKKYSSIEKINEYTEKFLQVKKALYDKDIIEEDVVSVVLPHDFKFLLYSNNTKAKEYVINRGLTIKDIWKYKLGVSNDSLYKNRILVPSFTKAGELNFFVARSYEKFVKPKYLNPNVDKTQIIFNESNIDWTKQIVLCEGVFDMFKCGDNAIPLLGSELDEQYDLFTKIMLNKTPVALALDRDMWHTKTPKLYKKLCEYDVDVKVVDTRGFEDPALISSQQFNDVLSQATKLSWSSSFMMKLNKASMISL